MSLMTQSGHWYEQSEHCYEHCSRKRPQSERCQNRPRRGPAALSSLWTSAWLIAASLFIGPDLFWRDGGPFRGRGRARKSELALILFLDRSVEQIKVCSHRLHLVRHFVCFCR